MNFLSFSSRCFEILHVLLFEHSALFELELLRVTLPFHRHHQHCSIPQPCHTCMSATCFGSSSVRKSTFKQNISRVFGPLLPRTGLVDILVVSISKTPGILDIPSSIYLYIVAPYISHRTDCCLKLQYGKSCNLRPTRPSLVNHTFLALQTSLSSSTMPTYPKETLTTPLHTSRCNRDEPLD